MATRLKLGFAGSNRTEAAYGVKVAESLLAAVAAVLAAALVLSAELRLSPQAQLELLQSTYAAP